MPRQGVKGQNLNPADGAMLFFYEVGTTTPKTTYTDEALSVASSNPVIADATGLFASIWMNGDTDAVLKDKNGVQLWGPEKVIDAAVEPDAIISFATVALATASTKLSVGDVISIIDRADALFTVTSGISGADTFRIIADDATTNSLVLHTDFVINSVHWGADGDTFGFDNTPVFDAIVTFVQSRGLGADIVSPSGEYFFSGGAATDTGSNPHKNGIFVPFSVYTQNPKLRFIGEGQCTFRAQVSDLIILRMSNPGTEAINIMFEGAGQAASWGVGMVPGNRDQGSGTEVSQSYCKVERCHFLTCDEGLVAEPGWNNGPSDSGCFYLRVLNCDFNLNIRCIWFKASLTNATNRPTRSNITDSRFERGNVGVDLDFATETTIVGCNYQLFVSGSDPSSGSGPRGSNQTAIYLGANTENTTVIGGAPEANNWNVDNQATVPNNMFIGFGLTGVGNNLGLLNKHVPHQLYLTHSTAVNQSVGVFFKNSSFATILADPTAAGTKQVVINTNGVDRARWFNGKFTHHGSASDIEFDAVGATMNFTAGMTLTSSGGAARIVASTEAVYLRVGSDDNLEIDANATANETRMLVWDVESGQLERVSVGANDSGGSGFRLLRIPNS